MTDIAVIGGGPAGLTAALYAVRAGKSVTVYERECIGGQITRAPLVENYPGTGTVSGLQIGDSMAAQAEAAGAVICRLQPLFPTARLLLFPPASILKSKNNGTNQI